MQHFDSCIAILEQTGSAPLGLFVVKKNCEKSADKVIKDAIATVRNRIGPVAAFTQALVVPALPKTRSGKIARPSLTNMAAGKAIKVINLHSTRFKPLSLNDLTV